MGREGTGCGGDEESAPGGSGGHTRCGHTDGWAEAASKAWEDGRKRWPWFCSDKVTPHTAVLRRPLAVVAGGSKEATVTMPGLERRGPGRAAGHGDWVCEATCKCTVCVAGEDRRVASILTWAPWGVVGTLTETTGTGEGFGRRRLNEHRLRACHASGTWGPFANPKEPGPAKRHCTCRLYSGQSLRVNGVR